LSFFYLKFLAGFKVPFFPVNFSRIESFFLAMPPPGDVASI